MIDLDNIKQLAKKFEIDGFSILREYLQIRFLDEFYKNHDLKNTYFKGGTAIRLLFGSSRFSEDLDFTTYENKEKLETILASVVNKLGSEFPSLTIKELETIEGYSAKLYLPTEIASHPLTVKLDFSQREKVGAPLTSPIETELPIGGVSLVEHLSEKEILAEKVRALMARRKGRDLFDLWYLLSKGVLFDKDLIDNKLKFYDEKFQKEKLIEAIEHWDQKDIDQDLRRFLPLSQRKVINQLKRIVLAKLK